MRIVNNTEPTTIEVKRFYTPFTLYDNCPKCGSESTSLATGDYLSYPVVNGPERINFYCGKPIDSKSDCDTEWSKWICITLTAKEVDDPEKVNATPAENCHEILDYNGSEVACMRAGGHDGECIALACDAADADGVCHRCRQPIPEHLEGCHATNGPS